MSISVLGSNYLPEKESDIPDSLFNKLSQQNETDEVIAKLKQISVLRKGYGKKNIDKGDDFIDKWVDQFYSAGGPVKATKLRLRKQGNKPEESIEIHYEGQVQKLKGKSIFTFSVKSDSPKWGKLGQCLNYYLIRIYESRITAEFSEELCQTSITSTDDNNTLVITRFEYEEAKHVNIVSINGNLYTSSLLAPLDKMGNVKLEYTEDNYKDIEYVRGVQIVIEQVLRVRDIDLFNAILHGSITEYVNLQHPLNDDFINLDRDDEQLYYDFNQDLNPEYNNSEIVCKRSPNSDRTGPTST
jgi:hypothetical protein